MGDFFQNGIIANFHNLVDRPVEDLEEELRRFRKTNPIGLILPSLFSELEMPALEGIIQELSQVDYVDEIVVGLDRANEDEFRYALKYFGRLPQRLRILWNDGPRLMEIDQKLKEIGLAPAELGKGRNVWYCIGYAQASNRTKAIALHDCDVVTYSRSMLARLIYPVANPAFGYQFCKGYYARVADQKLNGRVCRLLVGPLLHSLKKVFGADDFLDYLSSFRYVLSGEFSLRSDILKNIRIPSDWGLEIGVLAELHRNYSVKSICQVDIADVYDHKHQDLSPDDASAGLSKMSRDITKAIYRKLAINGQLITEEHFRTIKAAYYRTALDYVEVYYNDGVINGLKVDRHKEEEAVELFAKNIMDAGEDYLANPMATPFMPSWSRVISAVPHIFEQLEIAVEEDAKQYSS
ncbi:glycosyl transferase [Gynuella sunshinyii]|uniref:Glycosyl transferase n=1 Tax=Gynuella sunshinyii YC6258 TaxID=1445510 RepID=A0A0C5VNI1_9GAMM|nr:glycosyl transferase [Gynuella sunshinyii]AJQ94953.1 hypothetical Protein YC6258_02915 [Gynuella sunshinyii YC6258]